MAITRTPMIDDDGSGTTGTIINNAWKTELYNQIDAAAGGLPQAYTPVWTSAGGAAPVVGNGSLTGQWARMGGLVWANITLVIGSTTTLGGGGWVFSLPVGIAVSTGTAVQCIGNTINGFGGAAVSTVGCFVVTSTSINPFAGAVGVPAVGMDATHPAGWVAGNRIDLFLMYRG